MRDPLAQRRGRDDQEQHARPEDDPERGLPRHVVLEDDREGEEGVETHARRDRERQARVEAHEQRHAAGDQHRRREHA
jgi:hypothetical protein